MTAVTLSGICHAGQSFADPKWLSPLQRHSISAGCTFREVGCIPVNLPVLFRSSGSKKKTSKKCNSGHGHGNDVPQIAPAYKNDQPKMWCVRRVTKLAGHKYNTRKCCCIVISLSGSREVSRFQLPKRQWHCFSMSGKVPHCRKCISFSFSLPERWWHCVFTHGKMLALGVLCWK